MMLRTSTQRAALAAELANNPGRLGYAGIADAAAVRGVLATADRTRARHTVPPSEVAAAIDPAESAALAKVVRDQLSTILADPALDVTRPVVMDGLRAIFREGTNSRVALEALLTETVDRAAEIGLPLPTEHQIEMALGTYADPMVDPGQPATPPNVDSLSDADLAALGMVREPGPPPRIVRV